MIVCQQKLNWSQFKVQNNCCKIKWSVLSLLINFIFLDLVDKWVQLGNEVSPLYKEGLQQRQLHQQVQAVRNKLLEHETLVLGIGVDGDFQLNLNKIRQLKIQIEAMKDLLLQVNVDVHSCVAQQPTAATGINLKEDVAGLYQMWERLTIKASEKETLLEDAERTWKDFNEQLLNLKAEIAADQKKVKSIIDLQQGDSPQPTPDASLDSCQSRDHYNQSKKEFVC